MQATEATKEFVGQNDLKTTNAHATRASRNDTDKYTMMYTGISQVYIFLSIITLAKMFQTFVTCLYKCQDICDTIIRMSEYFLKGKYSPAGCRTLIL